MAEGGLPTKPQAASAAGSTEKHAINGDHFKVLSPYFIYNVPGFINP